MVIEMWGDRIKYDNGKKKIVCTPTRPGLYTCNDVKREFILLLLYHFLFHTDNDMCVWVRKRKYNIKIYFPSSCGSYFFFKRKILSIG